MQMKMTLPLNISNVMAYITKAREYHLLLQSYYADNAVLNDTIRTAFLSGAPTQLRQMLEVAIVNAGNDTIDLPRLFKAAEEFGRIFHTEDPSLGAKALAASGSSAGITDPNAMEVDNIHIQLNNIHKQLGTLHRSLQSRPTNGTNNPSRDRPAPLTAADREYLVRNGGCFRCRELGHISPNCPKYGNGSRGINQVTAGESPDSGKASGN
ncbi:hypothetical protein EMPS_10860 [Entomortierella parvispora]|uniref:CCHC-type domain-containing protein n=1 Tax=Entomortierella parvispora TaxID=205924 RepID=A0A9P3HKY3_9FUNG|nr:hypothetical protein EMPS_10860 [Entomortierella parvispora]